jgi:hypothetical protein
VVFILLQPIQTTLSSIQFSAFLFANPSFSLHTLAIATMQFITSIIALALAGAAVASPTGTLEARQDPPAPPAPASQYTTTPLVDGCLTDAQTDNLVAGFKWLLENPTAPNFAVTARTLFGLHFTDTSDSINQVIGLPVSEPDCEIRLSVISLSKRR